MRRARLRQPSLDSNYPQIPDPGRAEFLPAFFCLNYAKNHSINYNLICYFEEALALAHHRRLLRD